MQLRTRRIAVAGCMILLLCSCKRFSVSDLGQFQSSIGGERDALMEACGKSDCLIGMTYVSLSETLGSPDNWTEQVAYSITDDETGALVIDFDHNGTLTRASLSAMSENTDPLQIEFSEEVWKHDRSNRVAMARWIVANKSLNGKSHGDVMRILGNPTSTLGPAAIYYGRIDDREIRVYGKALQVHFNDAGAVECVEYSGT